MAMTNISHSADTHSLFIFKGNSLLVEVSENIVLPTKSIYEKFLEYHVASDWFAEPEQKYIAMSVEEDAAIPPGYRWMFLRELIAYRFPETIIASRALALLNWRKKYRFCGKCGQQLHDASDETARVCIHCGSIFYPALSPAMIVLVQREDKILLARHKHRNTDIFTCLAGYIEAGESVEHCVSREVMEEAEITVRDIRYVGSRSWPFPDQLMLAFTAHWESGELSPETSEINELRWFPRDNLPPLPPIGSVARALITGEKL